MSAVTLLLVDVEGWSAAYAPDAEFTDHRALVGLPPARGRGELLRRIEAWSEPNSLGERYVDQIKVSKAGPIGFMP